jgi:hypothetical protein
VRTGGGEQFCRQNSGGDCYAVPPSPMIVLSWNCRGLGNPGTVHDLHRLIKEKKHDLVFLMETKIQNKKCDFHSNKIGF